jgi:hypothetical protein
MNLPRRQFLHLAAGAAALPHEVEEMARRLWARHLETRKNGADT